MISLRSRLGQYLLAGFLDLSFEVDDIDHPLAAGQQFFDRTLGHQFPLVIVSIFSSTVSN